MAKIAEGRLSRAPRVSHAREVKGLFQSAQVTVCLNRFFGAQIDLVFPPTETKFNAIFFAAFLKPGHGDSPTDLSEVGPATLPPRESNNCTQNSPKTGHKTQKAPRKKPPKCPVMEKLRLVANLNNLPG